VYVTWRVESSLTGRAGEMEFGRALDTHGLKNFIGGFVAVPSQKYTCPLYGVPDYTDFIEQ